MIDHETIDHAIAAHAKWKFNLRKAIETGASEWTVEDAQAADRCEFGRWLHDLRLSDRLNEHAREVIQLHADFHSRAADALKLALDGQQRNAEAALAASSDFARVSSKLTLAMMAWKKSLAGTAPKRV